MDKLDYLLLLKSASTPSQGGASGGSYKYFKDLIILMASSLEIGFSYSP